MLFMLLFCSLCSFRFDKAWKLFLYGFNKGKSCSRKAENAISKTLHFKILRGSMPPDPPSSSRLRRSWLAPPINLTLPQHCFCFPLWSPVTSSELSRNRCYRLRSLMTALVPCMQKFYQRHFIWTVTSQDFVHSFDRYNHKMLQ